MNSRDLTWSICDVDRNAIFSDWLGWFHARSSHVFQNSNGFSVSMNSGLCDGSKNLEVCDQPLSSHQPFCTGLTFASASAAQRPLHFGSQADFTISVSREVSENTVLPGLCCHFRRMFRIWFPRTACGCMQICFLQIICEPQLLRKMCQRVIRNFLVILFLLRVSEGSHLLPVQFRHFALILDKLREDHGFPYEKKGRQPSAKRTIS